MYDLTNEKWFLWGKETFGSAFGKKEDLTFRKVWTIRNMFSSRVMLDEMDFSKLPSGSGGALNFQNVQPGILEIENVGETDAPQNYYGGKSI